MERRMRYRRHERSSRKIQGFVHIMTTTQLRDPRLKLVPVTSVIHVKIRKGGVGSLCVLPKFVGETFMGDDVWVVK